MTSAFPRIDATPHPLQQAYLSKHWSQYAGVIAGSVWVFVYSTKIETILKPLSSATVTLQRLNDIFSITSHEHPASAIAENSRQHFRLSHIDTFRQPQKVFSIRSSGVYCEKIEYRLHDIVKASSRNTTGNTRKARFCCTSLLVCEGYECRPLDSRARAKPLASAGNATDLPSSSSRAKSAW